MTADAPNVPGEKPRDCLCLLVNVTVVEAGTRAQARSLLEERAERISSRRAQRLR